MLQLGLRNAAHTYPEGTVNTSGYPFEYWSKALSNILRIMFKHIRELKRDNTRMILALKEQPSAIGSKLTAILAKVKLQDATSIPAHG